MHRVVLINMPFSNLGLPSIALTQLKAAVDAHAGSVGVATEVFYASHDFAHYLGIELYSYLTNSGESMNTGLGEWFFRAVAFPSEKDNTVEYFRRYFPSSAPSVQKRREEIVEKRSGLAAFLDSLISQYALQDISIAGFTSMFMQHTASFAMSRRLKDANPNIVTVIGGANCDFPMGGVIARQVQQIDYVFSGPGLRNFPTFVTNIIAGRPEDCSSIRGVFTRGQAVPLGGPDVVGEELPIDTELPLDYEPFLQRIAAKFPDAPFEASLPFETSRGCWWGEKAHCTFCGLNGESMAYRAMKPELAVRQFKSLFQYADRVKKLEAVDNILPKSYFTEVLPRLDTPPGMTIFYEVKADLNEESIAALSLGGVTQIQPGIEALATSTLKLMKKGTTAFQNVTLLRMCALYGIQPIWNLLVGFPGEQEDTYRRYVDVLPLLTHLPPPNGVYPVRFDRFSPYFTKAKEYGLELEPLDFYSLVYPFPKEEIGQMAYYFADRNIQAEYFTSMAKWLGKMRAKVSQWHTRWVDGVNAPRLRFDGDRIVDSRAGVATRHYFGKEGRSILDFLQKPKRIEDVVKTFGLGADGLLQQLEKAGLIFREGDRLLSLVLDVEHGSRKGTQPQAESSVPVPSSQLLQIKPISLA